MKEKIELYKNWINSKTAKIFFVIIAIINSKIIFCSLASMVEDNKLPIIFLFLFFVILIGGLSYFGLNFFMNIETELNLKMDY